MMPTSRVVKALTLLCVAATVGACSGGGGNESRPPDLSGTTDMSYGTAGKVSFPASDSIMGAAVDSAGNAYVAGGIVAKLDRSGIRASGYGGPVSPVERAPLPDGAGGLFTVSDEGIVKRDPAGQLATSFGVEGRVRVTPWIGTPEVPDRVFNVHRDAAGNLMAVGLALGVNFPAHASALFVGLAKVDALGHWVEGFGVGGRKALGLNFHPFNPGAASALDAQGNLLIAGRGISGGYVIGKLDANGEPVLQFANHGFWGAPFCGTADNSDVAIASAPSGDVFLGVSCEGAPTVFKLDALGNLVGSFGSAGRAGGFFPNGGSVGALLPAADGSVFVAGAAPAPACKQLAVSKLFANGTPVSGFGNAGLALPGAPADDSAKVLALDASGMLYVAGRSPAECPVANEPGPYVIFRLRP